MGAKLAYSINNGGEYSCSVQEHIVIPEAQYAKSLRLNYLVASNILHLTVLMLTSVQFNYEFCVNTREICHKTGNRNLAPESMAAQLPAA